MPRLRAGELRHRIKIEEPGEPEQDSVTGEVTRPWTTVVENEPAAIEPLSVRDYIASGARQDAIAARVKIRWRPGLHARMRIVTSEGLIYNPAGWLPDPDSGREYVTAPCTAGVNEGQ